jgi:probable HAF family extracellular repeat protein
MHTLRLLPLLAVSALVLLASCRDRTESLVGPPEGDASFAETLALKRGVATDVNESGVATGWVEGDRAFRWARGGQLQVLGTLGGTYSRGAFINAAGQVTGVSTTSDGARHVFLWTSGVPMRSLGTLGGGELVVTAFSDSGHVVGWGTQANGSRTGFIARAGPPAWGRPFPHA